MAMSVWRRRRPSGVTIPLLERSVPPEIHYFCKTLEPSAARVRALRCTALLLVPMLLPALPGVAQGQRGHHPHRRSGLIP